MTEARASWYPVPKAQALPAAQPPGEAVLSALIFTRLDCPLQILLRSKQPITKVYKYAGS